MRPIPRVALGLPSIRPRLQRQGGYPANWGSGLVAAFAQSSTAPNITGNAQARHCGTASQRITEAGPDASQLPRPHHIPARRDARACGQRDGAAVDSRTIRRGLGMLSTGVSP